MGKGVNVTVGRVVKVLVGRVVGVRVDLLVEGIVDVGVKVDSQFRIKGILPRSNQINPSMTNKQHTTRKPSIKQASKHLEWRSCVCVFFRGEL